MAGRPNEAGLAAANSAVATLLLAAGSFIIDKIVDKFIDNLKVVKKFFTIQL